MKNRPPASQPNKVPVRYRNGKTHSHKPGFLPVGTKVSARYKGAFCTAVVESVEKRVDCQVFFLESPHGACILRHDKITSGVTEVGERVLALPPLSKKPFKGEITRVTDRSVYTVVFNDGDRLTVNRRKIVIAKAQNEVQVAPLFQNSSPAHEEIANAAPPVAPNVGPPNESPSNEDTPNDGPSSDDRQNDGPSHGDALNNGSPKDNPQIKKPGKGREGNANPQHELESRQALKRTHSTSQPIPIVENEELSDEFVLRYMLNTVNAKNLPNPDLSEPPPVGKNYNFIPKGLDTIENPKERMYAIYEAMVACSHQHFLLSKLRENEKKNGGPTKPRKGRNPKRDSGPSEILKEKGPNSPVGSSGSALKSDFQSGGEKSPERKCTSSFSNKDSIASCSSTVVCCTSSSANFSAWQYRDNSDETPSSVGSSTAPASHESSVKPCETATSSDLTENSEDSDHSDNENDNANGKICDGDNLNNENEEYQSEIIEANANADNNAEGENQAGPSSSGARGSDFGEGESEKTSEPQVVHRSKIRNDGDRQNNSKVNDTSSDDDADDSGSDSGKCESCG